MSDSSHLDKEAAERAHLISHELGKQANEGAIKAAEGAIKAAAVLNGGAAAALLAFVGNRNNQVLSLSNRTDVAFCLSLLVGGLLTASICFGMAYIVNYAYMQGFFAAKRDYQFPYVHRSLAQARWTCFGSCTHIIAIAALLLSYGLFVTAAVKLYALLPTLMEARR